MRLYILTANWGKGGPGGIAADLYNVATNAGLECRFAYGREEIPAYVNSYRIGNFFSPYIHAASAMIFDNAGFATRKPTLDLIKDIASFNPDVISLHNPLGYTINLGILFDFLKEAKFPIVWTIHDIWSITGHCITGLCENWKNGCGHCPNKREYPASFVFDRSRHNLKKKIACFSNVPNMRLVSPSKWLSNLTRNTYLKQYPIYVIPNGIDLDVFKSIDSDLRKQYGLEDKTVLLSVAGVWTKNKGAEFIYRLSEMLSDEYTFVMIGKNKDRALRKIKKIIHIERTTDRIQLAQWYSTADLLVNPTMGDNFPTVNIEALACGTPVITFNTGGSGEAIEEGCGIVIPCGDTKKLFNAIISFGKKSNCNDECIERAKCYDKNKRYEEYLILFENCSKRK